METIFNLKCGWVTPVANTSSVTGGFRLVPLEIPLFNEFFGED